MLLNTLLLLTFLFPQQIPDHSDKPCVVTEVLTQGVKSDCKGWKPAPGEKMFMFGDVSKLLQVGDVFYFVWKGTRWVAEIETEVIHCNQTGATQREFLLSCNDPQKSELLIPVGEWPSVWHGPELGFTYSLSANGMALPSLPTQADKEAYELRMERIRENQLKELRRWRIPPLQSLRP